MAKLFEVTGRAPIIESDNWVNVRQLAEHCKKPYTTTYSAMTHMNAPRPRIVTSDLMLFEQESAFAYLRQRGWKVPPAAKG